MWQRLFNGLACWFGRHDWEALGGSFGVGSVSVCRRCGRQDN